MDLVLVLSETEGGLQRRLASLRLVKMYKKQEDTNRIIIVLQIKGKDVEGLRDVLFKIVSTDTFEQNVINLRNIGEKRVGVNELRNMLACPFNHSRVCEALLNLGNNGKSGCKGGNSGCSKFHPRFCHYSLNKGV